MKTFIPQSFLSFQFVGNRAKERILKQVFKKKARQISRKTNICYALIRTRMYVCVSGGKKCLFFGCAYQRERNVHFSEYLACFVSVLFS